MQSTGGFSRAMGSNQVYTAAKRVSSWKLPFAICPAPKKRPIGGGMRNRWQKNLVSSALHMLDNDAIFICGAADRSGREKSFSSSSWEIVFKMTIYSFLGCEKQKPWFKLGV